MDTEKLTKAIQILIREELKVILPKLIKETVKKEVQRSLNELSQPSVVENETSMPRQKSFLDEDVVSENPIKETKQYSKNPVLNEVLSQTEPFNSKQRSGGDDGFRTMNFDQSDVHTVAQRKIADQGGMGSQQRTGLGVNTGDENLDKALNRDYTQLVKAMDKRGRR